MVGAPIDHEHGGVHGLGAESIQGFLERLNLGWIVSLGRTERTAERLGGRTTKVAGAAVIYALAGDEPAPDQSQDEPHDETHTASRDGNSA